MQKNFNIRKAIKAILHLNKREKYHVMNLKGYLIKLRGYL